MTPLRQPAMEQGQTLSGRNILVTGARGFLGSHLVERLLSSGAKVHGTSREAHAREPKEPIWWRTDLLHYEEVRDLVARTDPDIIVHFAGHITADPDVGQVLPTYSSLLTSTVNLLTAAQLQGCSRIVLSGSLTEPPAGRVDAAPSSPYAAAKWAGTAYGRMFHALYGTPVVIVRPLAVYGPRQQENKIIPYVIRSFLQGRAPELSSGKWSADWIYIADFIDGMIKALEVPFIEGSTIDLGTGELTSLRDLALRIAKLMDAGVAPLFGALQDRPNEQIRKADMSAACSRLGWKPHTSLEEGLRLTIEWIRARQQADEAHAM